MFAAQGAWGAVQLSRCFRARDALLRWRLSRAAKYRFSDVAISETVCSDIAISESHVIAMFGIREIAAGQMAWYSSISTIIR